MAYVQRDDSGKVTGVYANQQPDYADEELPDDAVEVVAFLSRSPSIGSISRRQFFQQAAIGGIISESEALAAVTTGALPASVTAFINTLPSGQQFGAKMLFAVNEFNRSSTMADAFGQSIGMTPEQIDTFFLAASEL